MIPGTYVRQISEIQSYFMVNTLCVVSSKSLCDVVIFRVGSLKMDRASSDFKDFICSALNKCT